MKELETVYKLNSGAIMYDLEDIVSVDLDDNLELAQKILDYGSYTNIIDADSAYNERIINPFVGVYEVSIDSIAEYNRYIDMLVSTPNLSHVPCFEEWKANMVEVNGKRVRLGKWMKREKVAEEIIHFYSQQIRTGQEKYYLTISDLPHHIVGMTYNAKDWHSCQHPDQAESVNLGGALHDSGLLVAMLHKDIDDLQDMEGKLLARVNMRIMDIDNTLHCMPSRYYGTNDTREAIHRCLDQLKELRIHSRAIRYDDTKGSMNRLDIEMACNGSYDMTRFEYVWISEEVYEEVDIECPLCKGHETYEVYSDNRDMYVDIACPLCSGSGKHSIQVSESIDTETEIEEELELLTYSDDYHNCGYRIIMGIDADRWKEYMEEFGN